MSILEVNLLKLTRKYQCLEEQEKLLRREYHAKDQDMAKKDEQTMWRINELKGWKQRAILQLKLMQDKLKLAIPVSEFEIVNKEVALAKQKENDSAIQYAKLASQHAELVKRHREGIEAEVNLRTVQESKEQMQEEYEIVKKRLEHFDPVFKQQN